MTEKAGQPFYKAVWFWSLIAAAVIFLVILAIFKFNPEAYGEETNVPQIAPTKNLEQKFYDSNFDFKEYTKLFEQDCPDLNTCDMEAIKKFVVKLIIENYTTQQIPRVDSIKQVVKARLKAQRANLTRVDNFWENYPTLVAGRALKILTDNEIEDWIKYLLSFNSTELCLHLYDLEPDKTRRYSKYYIPLQDEKLYESYCHLRWADTIVTLVPDYGEIISYLESLGFKEENVKQKLCKDISILTKKDYFNFLSGFGLAYILNKVICSRTLNEQELQKLKQEMDQAGDTPKTRYIKSIYQRLI